MLEPITSLFGDCKWRAMRAGKNVDAIQPGSENDLTDYFHFADPDRKIEVRFGSWFAKKPWVEMVVPLLPNRFNASSLNLAVTNDWAEERIRTLAGLKQCMAIDPDPHWCAYDFDLRKHEWNTICDNVSAEKMVTATRWELTDNFKWSCVGGWAAIEEFKWHAIVNRYINPYNYFRWAAMDWNGREA